MGCLCPTPKPSKIDPIQNPSDSITINSFKRLKLLGRGNFGKVFLVKKTDSSEIFAMKTLSKKFIQEKKQRPQTLNERNILANSECHFLVKLFYSFQDKKKVYLVMEYLQGGELFFHLSNQGAFSELRARFYISEIILGLEYLHGKGIIYRDLKPENILIDLKGHVRLTDFGLCKILDDQEKTKTFCGTPEYLAPEVITRGEYGKSADFWSLGAVLYYMLSGSPPHYNHNKKEILKKVVSIPVNPILKITDQANDFVLNLLKIDPDQRLKDFETIKNHKWFEGVNWEDFSALKTSPPFVPKCKKEDDVLYFDKLFTGSKAEDTASAEVSGAAMNYSGFSYRYTRLDGSVRSNL